MKEASQSEGLSIDCLNCLKSHPYICALYGVKIEV